MVLTTTRHYTAEDLRAMPGDEPWELWDGELTAVPGSGGRSSRVAGRIVSRIDAYLEEHDLGIVTGADGTYILRRDRDTVLVPDAAFVRWDRLPGEEETVQYIPVAPDLAVEVQSPSDEPGKMAQKRSMYFGAGVSLVWWVDPETRTVTVYRPGADPVALAIGDALDGDDVLPGLRIPVADVFPPPRRRRP